MSVVLGLNAGVPNSAAALIVDGQLIGAVEEERFNGIKRWRGWPQQTIDWLLQQGDVEAYEVTHVALNFRPESYHWGEVEDRLDAELPVSAEDRRHALSQARVRAQDRVLTASRLFPSADVTAIKHHVAHARYAFCASPFDKATVIVLDSIGEAIGSSIYRFADDHSAVRYDTLWEDGDSGSLGFFYGLVTEHLGWQKNADEGTVMALAGWGDPTRFREIMAGALRWESTSLRADPSLIPRRIRRHPQTFLPGFVSATVPARVPRGPISRDHADFAAAAQNRLETLILSIVQHASKLGPADNLVICGGVAENCVANALVMESELFGRISVPPAPGDSGTALGSALALVSTPDAALRTACASPFLGPRASREIWGNPLVRAIEGSSFSPSTSWIVEHVISGEVIAVVEGEAEFGPRALGHRSLIAFPGVAGIRDRLNKSVKKREWFRPFAPLVRMESASKYFEVSDAQASSLSGMGFAPRVRAEWAARLREVTHKNGRARVQTVTMNGNPLLWAVLGELERQTGLGVLINTSLNISGHAMSGTDPLLSDFVDATMVSHFVVEGIPFARLPKVSL